MSCILYYIIEKGLMMEMGGGEHGTGLRSAQGMYTWCWKSCCL